MPTKLFSRRSFKVAINFVLIIAVFLLFYHFALAQDLGTNYVKETGLKSAKGQDIRVLIVNVVRYLLTFVGIIAVSMIMYSGFLWMTSEGDAEKVGRAKKTLINSSIGLVITVSAFAIVTFVLHMMDSGTSTHHLAGGGHPGVDWGYGAIGSCSVENVYPVPNQKDVPRNTIVVVSFKNSVQASSVCSDSNGNNVCDNEDINMENVRILHTNEADDSGNDCLGCDTGAGASGCPCQSQITDARVSQSADGKTFTFTFPNPIGSPSEYVSYTVYMNNGVLDEDGKGVFDNCSNDYLRWNFEVSNKLDLTPPQIKVAGVFPYPDNLKDDLQIISANKAVGTTTVIDNTKIIEHTTTTFPARSISEARSGPDITLSERNDELSVGGTYLLSVNEYGTFLNMSVDGKSMGQAQIENNGTNIIARFNGFFTVEFSDTPSAGNSWSFDITSAVQGDTLRVADRVFVFGDDIDQGANAHTTAQNIANAINSVNLPLSASVNGDSVVLTAKQAGVAGNNIALQASNPSALEIKPMSGGTAEGKNRTIQDKKDQPMNAVIQINFNEAMNPLIMSGDAEDLATNGLLVRVLDCYDNNGDPTLCPGASVDGFFDCDGAGPGTDPCVAGKFEVSNNYGTLEFVPDNLCGVNSCGENVYCLPANTHLQVEVPAASLTTCTSDNDCASKNPYTSCVGAPSRYCQNDDGVNYPMANLPFDGCVDMAANSLDGDRSNGAEGKGSFYDENTKLGNGDNYQWSFYISDDMDLDPPVIESTYPSNNQTNIKTASSVQAVFNKLMMSGSLRTGVTYIDNGKEKHEHRLINLRNFSGGALGYWVSKKNIDNDPIDGVPDKTRLYIHHSEFTSTTTYVAQIGSGVRDIYQNCFKPSSGPACSGVNAVDETNPSCCSGARSNEETCD